MAAEASGRTPPAGQEQKAEATAAADAPRDVTVSSLMRTVAAQQSLLEEQGRQIEQLRREMAAIQAAVQHPPGAAAVAAVVATSQPATVPAVAGQGDEQGTPHFPELPPDLVTAGDFPGSFKLPGSDAALKIGGMVRVNWLSTYDPLQVDDRFQTSAIPMPGTSAGEGGGRVNIIAEPSRFNFDLRTPTGVGYMRAFIEGDFDGSKTTLRLRHAYGQWRRFIFGQTWSTFADPEAEPPGIDFEGLNAIVRFRQPQVRWSVPLSDRIRLAVALEDPTPEITNATGINQVPDFVARVRWDPARGGHLQFATLGRQLRAQSTDTPSDIVSTGAYGVNFSGKLPLPYGEKRDQLLFQYNAGHGIGRYVSDLRSLGGSDAVFDETANTLRPLDVSAGFVGLEHWWARRFRSSASYGFVDVQNLDIQPDDALHLTRRSSINFMWSPIPRLDLVTEFLWGTRQNKNGDHGFAAQTQFGSTFRF